MLSLNDSPSALVSAKATDALAGLGITTVGELLRYAPRRYVERGDSSGLPHGGTDETREGGGRRQDRLETGEWTTIIGRIVKSDVRKMKNRPGSFLKIVVTDDVQRFEATFFNPRSIRNQLRTGARVMLAGTVKYFNEQVQLTHPEWMILPEEGDPEIHRNAGTAMLRELFEVDAERAESPEEAAASDAARMSFFERPIMPMYHASKDIQTWTIWGAIVKALDRCDLGADALHEVERAERGLMTTAEALRKVHLPESDEDIHFARNRLKFDEALAIQTVLAQRRIAGRIEQSTACPHVPDGLEDQLLERLPFELTDGQKVVLEEISADLGASEPMSRLLQGEVGSGKTLVSLLAMLRVVDNGRQCAILAPTEVLAAQHYRTITTMLGDLALAGQLGAAPGATAVALLTGSMKTKGKRQTLLDVVSGTAGIAIGTHALLEDNVSFFDLGMVVVDEQHRFGVEQRDVLRGKGKDGRMPHFLVMTATPIPRTVALTAFGDLDTSTLRELPRGRQPITTTVVPVKKQGWVERVWTRAAEEVAAGRQIYVVCSRIGDQPEKNETGDAPRTTSVLEQYEDLMGGPLARCRVAMLHGRLPAEEKAEIMDAFGRGEVDVLVSTTVVEVGVDVPNATMMVIVDAERFGVSQLHQLRGRVGRGGLPGLCLLMTQAGEVSPSMERLKAVAASNDGFELARIDLMQRREGDVLGSLQSGGTSSLHFLSLLDDAEVLEDARELAGTVVGEDLTLLEHRPLADLVDAILAPQKVAYLDKS